MTHDQWEKMTHAERVAERNEWKDSAKFPSYLKQADREQLRPAREEAIKNLKLYSLYAPHYSKQLDAARPWTHYGSRS